LEPLELINLSRILTLSKGTPHVKIGIIDGPIDFAHPDFENLHFKTVHQSDLENCKKATSTACEHGTLVAGIMASKRGSPSPSICPNCTFILNPIFSDNQLFPFSTPEKLAIAIIETVDAGSNIINLSVSLSTPSMRKYSKLEDAIDYAISKKVLIVTAAGNQGKIALSTSFNKRNVIIVAACDRYGFPTIDTNLGGKNTLGFHIMAPGVDITSTIPNKGYQSVSGTSIATPFVTGTIALMASVFPNLSPLELKEILTETHKRNRTIIPPVLDTEVFYNELKKK